MSPCPAKFGSGHQISRVLFSSRNNTAFVTARTNILTYRWWEKTAAGAGGHPSTGLQQDGIGMGKKMCRLVITEFGLRLGQNEG
jgi:hypothetical protein